MKHEGLHFHQLVTLQFFFDQHSKLEQMIGSIVFLIVNNVMYFSKQTRNKNDKFYPLCPHEHQHESYPFATQHNSPRQTYLSSLSVAIFCVSHVNKQVAHISRIETFNLSHVSGCKRRLDNSFHEIIAKSLTSLVACLT
jgi:hypothetical protein